MGGRRPLLQWQTLVRRRRLQRWRVRRSINRKTDAAAPDNHTITGGSSTSKAGSSSSSNRKGSTGCICVESLFQAAATGKRALAVSAMGVSFRLNVLSSGHLPPLSKSPSSPTLRVGSFLPCPVFCPGLFLLPFPLLFAIPLSFFVAAHVLRCCCCTAGAAGAEVVMLLLFGISEDPLPP